MILRFWEKPGKGCDALNKVKNPPSNKDRKEWELLLEEYRSLRNEALAKMERQYKIIGLGVGGIGTLLGIAFQFQIYPLFLVLPLAIVSSMVLFDAERDSILNIGGYICNLEKEIITNSKLKGWEVWLRDGSEKRKAYKHFDYASLAILFVLLIGCIIGILCFSGEVSGFEILNNFLFRYIIASVYFVIGFYLFICYCWESR